MKAPGPSALLLGAFLALAGCRCEEVAPPVAPDLAPPPLGRSAPLRREEALAVIRSAVDAESAIRLLDLRRFGFSLDGATLEWFRQQGAPSEVIDYLAKRGSVDWENMRGDVDPRTPEVGQYVDPRRGFEDFVGSDARELFTSLRSINPFTTTRRPASGPSGD